MKNFKAALSLASIGVFGVIGVVLLVVGLSFGALAVCAWIGMLLMGAAHAQISESIPDVSFWGAFIGVLLLSFIGSFFRSSTTNSN